MPVLQFKTKEERLEHSVASLIPQSAWIDISLFNKSLDTRLLPLLEADSFEEALVRIQEIKAGDLSNELKGFCVLLKSGPLSMEEYSLLEKALCLDEYTLLLLATALGHADYIDAVCEQHTNVEMQEMIKANTFCAFGHACMYGQLLIAQKFYSIMCDDTLRTLMVCALDFISFRAACECDQLEVAQWLYELDDATKSAMLKAKEYYAFSGACAGGYLATAKWLFNLIDSAEIRDSAKIRFKMIRDAFLRACWNGHLEVVEWLYDQVDGNEMRTELIKTRDFMAFGLACAQGHLKIARWLYERVDAKQEMIAARKFSAFTMACANGHVDTAIWIYNLSDCQKDQETMVDVAFDYACKNDLLKSAQWLYDRFFAAAANEKIIQRKCITAFRGACENGQLSTAEWLYDLVDEKTKAIMPLEGNYCILDCIGPQFPGWLLAVSAELFNYVELFYEERLDIYIDSFVMHRLARFGKAGHSCQKEGVLPIRDYIMLDKFFANNDNECINHKQNLAIENLELFSDYAKAGGYNLICLKPPVNITNQKGPTCGYHAASYVTSIWNGTNKNYKYFSARTGSDRNKFFSLYSLAKDLRYRSLMARYGAIVDLNEFHEVFKDTGYAVRILSFQSPQQLGSQVMHLLENNCSIVFPLDNSDASYPGLSGGKRAHYVCIIGCVYINNEVRGCIYISHGQIMYTSIVNLYLSGMNLKEFTINEKYRQKALQNMKRPFDDSSDTADLSGLRGKMAVIYPDELSLDFMDESAQHVDHGTMSTILST